jgi:DNA-binding HxlR family transcriptional regulator
MTKQSVTGHVAALTRRRWLLPALAALHVGASARVPELARLLGASRGGVAEALSALLELGLLARVPPPRHPLQPEWQLTVAGARLAAIAAQLDAISRRLGASPLLRSRWALPVLAAIATPQRFNALGRALPGVTDRALAHVLSALAANGLVLRTVDTAARPPTTCYQLADIARPLAAALAALAADQEPLHP